MLSILIPTYNYNVFPLVQKLWEQCREQQIEFEILCQDDGSQSVHNIENSEILTLANCNFFINEQNIGRGKNINSLYKKSKYEWLLILDCDVMPVSDRFIENYLNTLKIPEIEVCYGGINYKKNRPSESHILRWVYGYKRESLSVEHRKKKPYQSSLTSNLLISRDVFKENRFSAVITNYGYEDLVFFYDLKLKNIKIFHIDNPATHINLDSSKVFLKKTRIAIENLDYLTNFEMVKGENRLLKQFATIEKYGLTKTMSQFYSYFKKDMEINLLSANPSMTVFDLYRLGYFSQLKLQ